MKDPVWNLTPEQAESYKKTLALFKQNKIQFVAFPYTSEATGQSLHKMRTKRTLKQDAIRRSLFRKHSQYGQTHYFSAASCDKARDDEKQRQEQKILRKIFA